MGFLMMKKFSQPQVTLFLKLLSVFEAVGDESVTVGGVLKE